MNSLPNDKSNKDEEIDLQNPDKLNTIKKDNVDIKEVYMDMIVQSQIPDVEETIDPNGTWKYKIKNGILFFTFLQASSAAALRKYIDISIEFNNNVLTKQENSRIPSILRFSQTFLILDTNQSITKINAQVRENLVHINIFRIVAIATPPSDGVYSAEVLFGNIGLDTTKRILPGEFKIFPRATKGSSLEDALNWLVERKTNFINKFIQKSKEEDILL